MNKYIYAPCPPKCVLVLRLFNKKILENAHYLKTILENADGKWKRSTPRTNALYFIKDHKGSIDIAFYLGHRDFLDGNDKKWNKHWFDAFSDEYIDDEDVNEWIEIEE